MRWTKKSRLPKIIKDLAQRMQTWAPPLMLGRYARRSELVEVVQAVGPVMAGRTDVKSGRIGKPDRRDPRHFVGLSVDHDLAPLSDTSESRVERVIGTFKDWGWLHFHALPPGRRKAKRGFLRCSSQQIERKENGDRRGLAAVRVWTDEIWRHYRLWPALQEALQKLGLAASRATANITIPSSPIVAQLADLLSADLAADPRPPP